MRGDEIPAPREGPKSALGISLDGVMVWVEDGWHEVKVASCFEFGPGKDGEVEARRVGYWASYGDVESFGGRYGGMRLIGVWGWRGKRWWWGTGHRG